MDALMKYPGAKWGIARWIIGFFPEHHSYLEPFLGSGAVLFNKPRSNIETVNDLDGDVVNLFKWIREDPEKLAYQVYFTPYSRQAHEDAYTGGTEGSLQKAVNFCIRINMGYWTRTTGEKAGWKNDVQGRERAYASRDWCRLPGKVMQAAERLRGVQIECMPAVDLMRRFNHKKVLVYLDPPYCLGTRHGKQYRHEMYSMESHEELLVAARQHKGPLLISGYESDLYNGMLGGWHKECIGARSQSGAKRTEVLWMNFDPYGRQMDISECLPGAMPSRERRQAW